MWSSQALQQIESTENVKTFAIVGFGLTGLSLFCQLIERLIVDTNNSNMNYRIKLFEKNHSYFATGSPYQENCPLIWTLNNPASKLKLLPNGIDMAVWMKENKNKWEVQFPNINEDYVPRSLVGLYLKDQYEVYKRKAKSQGISVDEHFDEIENIIQDENKTWKMTAKSLNQYQADFLFLCLGHVSSNQYSHLKNKPNYFHSDGNVEQLKCIPKDAAVYILGGQAKFVDIALWLAYVNHHTGAIYTVTRNSPIITTKGNKDVCDKIPLEELAENLKSNYSTNSLSISEGKLLFWNTYKKAAKSPINIDNPPTTRTALTYQLAKYDGLSQDDKLVGNIDELRSFIFTFYFSGCYREFWKKLKEEDKEEFNKQLYSHIFAYLTGITPINTRLLLELYDRNQIHEQSGLTNITYDDENKKFQIYLKDGSKLETKYLIDSSGLGYDIKKCHTEFPLFKNLIARGYLVPKNLGGVLINDCGQVINRNHQLQPNLFCIGPIASYGHPFPTPYASFIAVEVVEKALNAITNLLFISENTHEKKVMFC